MPREERCAQSRAAACRDAAVVDGGDIGLGVKADAVACGAADADDAAAGVGDITVGICVAAVAGGAARGSDAAAVIDFDIAAIGDKRACAAGAAGRRGERRGCGVAKVEGAATENSSSATGATGGGADGGPRVVAGGYRGRVSRNTGGGGVGGGRCGDGPIVENIGQRCEINGLGARHTQARARIDGDRAIGEGLRAESRRRRPIADCDHAIGRRRATGRPSGVHIPHQHGRASDGLQQDAAQTRRADAQHVHFWLRPAHQNRAICGLDTHIT